MIDTYSKLRLWQQENLRHLLPLQQKHGYTVDLSDGGTGKTFTAVSLIQELALPTLVICPKSLIYPWTVVGEMLGVEFDIINYEKLRLGKTPYGRWERPNRRFKEQFVWHEGVKLTVWDEAHNCGGEDTKQGRMLSAVRDQGLRGHLMTATLAETPLKMLNTGYVLDLHSGKKGLSNRGRKLREMKPRYPEWLKQVGCKKGWKGFEFIGSDDEKVEKMKEIHRSLLPSRGVRTSIPDLGDAFPETQIMAELYEPPGGAKRIAELYEEMQDALRALKERAANDKNPDNPMTRLTRTRQQIELIKVPIFEDIVHNALGNGQSVAVFLNYTQTIEELAARLKTSCIVWGVNQTAEERAGRINRFQGDKERVILLNIQAGGVGIGLHDVTGRHQRLSVISPGFNSVLLKQALWRVHRDGAKSKSLQRIICLAGTYEETVASVISSKIACMDALNDGDLMPL